MCLPIGSCFGFGAPPTDDTPAQSNGGGGGGYYNGTGNGGGHHYYNGNGNGGHYNGNGYYFPAAHGAAAGAEAGRKASNDVRGTGTARHAGATAAATTGGWGWHGHAATGAQEKAAYPHAGADGTLKKQQQPPTASNGRVAADGHGARGGAPQNREHAADSYYPAATATADHERY